MTKFQKGGSLLKFEGRICGDPTNWLLCNDFRKENFFCSIAKDFLFWGFREYRGKIIWEKHWMLPQSFSWQENTCMLYTFRRVHSSLFHVEIAKWKCKYQKWQRIILTTNHDFLGKCQRMGGNSKSILLNFHLSFIVLLMMLGTSVCYEMLPFQMQSCYETYSCSDLFSIHVIVFVVEPAWLWYSWGTNKKRGWDRSKSGKNWVI